MVQAKIFYLFWVLKRLNETNWGQVNFAINSHYSDEVKREHVESMSLKKVYAEYEREREENAANKWLRILNWEAGFFYLQLNSHTLI